MYSRRQHAAEAAFRSLFSLIFVVAGFGHMVRPDKIAQRLEQAPMGHLATMVAPADVLVVLTGIVLLAGGLGLLSGLRVRLAAVILIAVLIPITITAQIGVPDVGPLFKNVALFGGLIHFATTGAGQFSLDRLLLARKRQLVSV